MSFAYRNILMLKGHSAGVGDLLCSSSAWRALHDKFPDVRLHLAFLTQELGSASEKLIAEHHLLSTFNVLPKWPNRLADWRVAMAWFLKIARETNADLVIDFEPNGIRTSVLAWLARRRLGIQTVGVADVPGRSLFYQRSSGSRRAYVKRLGGRMPINYAERDYVALGCLDIRRDGRAIELRETPAAVAFRTKLPELFNLPSGVPVVGLNIGCGTPGAIDRRPSLPLLRALIVHLQKEYRCAVILTGAPYEREVNEELIADYVSPKGLPLINAAGCDRLIELPGLIRACALFVSSNSGPYHMAVGLRVPTIAVFNYVWTEYEHHHPWVRCVLAPSIAELPRLQAAISELRSAFPWSETKISQ